MGEGIAVAACGRMIADEHGGVKGVVHTVHHAHGAAAPATNDFHALGQFVYVQIDGIIVGIVHQNVVGAGSNGTLAGGLDLGGHLFGGGSIHIVTQFGLVPKGGAVSLDDGDFCTSGGSVDGSGADAGIKA